MNAAVVRVLLATAALGAGGCVSLEESAPPVAVLAAQGHGGHSAALEEGRTIYITRCAKCHRVYPVRQYSTAEWNDILPKMVAKSKMAPADESAVRGYVSAVLGIP